MSGTVVCPDCHATLEPSGPLGRVPHSWDALVYRCEECGVGWSNAVAAAQRRRITRQPCLNVPVYVREGLDQVLANAANVRNRRTKQWKFCSSESEDAVTWTVAQGLTQERRLDAFVPAEFRSSSADAPALLLWGVPVSGEAEDVSLRLADISAKLGERATSRSEPDVVLAWPDLIVFVEAKLRSANDRKPPSYSGWPSYLGEAHFSVEPEQVQQTGLYELVRNWRIGNELAGQRRFVLVNLGLVSLTEDVAALGRVTRQSQDRVVVARTWTEVLDSSTGWLREYAVERGLISESQGGRA